MAKATGLDAGSYAVTLVELDGSYKKPRLVKWHRERLAPAGATESVDLEAELVAEAVEAAVAEAGTARDGIQFAIPSRHAILRRLDIPFKGRDTIRKVIKGEVEGSIHSHNVDELVVDFHELEEHADGAKVHIAAVPKAGLRVQLQALERAGLEVERVDLDALALFRCAEWCGTFESGAADDGEEGDDGTSMPAVTHSDAVHVVVDVGHRSTRVLMVKDGLLEEVRAIRTGDHLVSDLLSQSYDLAPEDAREAARICIQGGGDAIVSASPFEDVDEEAAEPESDGDEDGESGAVVVREVTVSHAEVTKAVDRFHMRLRRELERFLTATAVEGTVVSVSVTGGGSRWPGTVESIGEIFGVTGRVLPVLDGLAHRLDEEEAQQAERELAVAVGMALGELGGTGPRYNFRQEELAFAKGFDRIKFPLTIACILGLFALLTHLAKRYKDLEALEMQYGATYYGKTWSAPREVANTTKFQFYGFLSSLANDGRGWFSSKDNFNRKEYRELLNDLEEKPVFKRLQHCYNVIKRRVDEQMRESGVYEDLQLPSGYAVLCRFAEVVKQVEPQLGRYLLSELDLSLPARGTRFLQVEVAFRGDARTRMAALRAAFEADIAKGDGPFAKVLNAKEVRPFSGGEKSGMFFELRLQISETYDPFPGAEFRQ